MYIRNNTAAVIFRMVFVIVCGAGLVMKLIYSDFSIDRIMGDFALISNALALIYFAYLIIVRTNYEKGVLRGAVTIYMIITFIVYSTKTVSLLTLVPKNSLFSNFDPS